MSHFRASFGVVQRSTGGSALRRSAYARCDVAGEFDFTAKADEFVSGEVMLPEGANLAFLDPEALWTAAENAENRGNSQTARTLDFAIPHEIHPHLHATFARHLLTEFTELGFAVEYTIQRDDCLFEDGLTEGMNNHIHSACTMRQLDENGFSRTKDRTQNDRFKRDILITRANFAEKMNDFFKIHGIEAHVDSRCKADSAPEEPVVPVASPTIRGILKRAQAARKAGRDVVLPAFVQDYLHYRAVAMDAIKEFRAAKAELAALNASTINQKKESTDVRNHEVEEGCPAAPAYADSPRAAATRDAGGQGRKILEQAIEAVSNYGRRLHEDESEPRPDTRDAANDPERLVRKPHDAGERGGGSINGTARSDSETAEADDRGPSSSIELERRNREEPARADRQPSPNAGALQAARKWIHSELNAKIAYVITDDLKEALENVSEGNHDRATMRIQGNELAESTAAAHTAAESDFAMLEGDDFNALSRFFKAFAAAAKRALSAAVSSGLKM